MGNCYDKPAPNHTQSDHKRRRSRSKDKEQKKLNKDAIKRLNREIDMFKELASCNSSKSFDESYSIVLKYYNSLKCSLPCQYVGYCVQHHDLAFTVDHIKLIYGFSDRKFDKYNKLTFQLIGPPGSNYHGRLFELNVIIPGSYPKSPPLVKFSQNVYHLNVNQETNELMYLTLTESVWHASTRLF